MVVGKEQNKTTEQHISKFGIQFEKIINILILFYQNIVYIELERELWVIGHCLTELAILVGSDRVSGQ